VQLRSLVWSASLGTLVALATGCAGGGSHALPQPYPAPTGTSTAPTYSGQRAPATLTLTIPAPTTSAAAGRRGPAYIPATAHTVAVQVLEVGGSPVSDAAQTSTLTPGSGSCSTVSAGDYTCTVTAQMPIGTDETQISIEDASSNLLAETLYSATVVEGHANTFGSVASPITLDANPGAITANTQTSGTSFAQNGTSAESYTLAVVDAHGTAFGSQPGLPTFANNAAVTGCSGSTTSVSGATLTLTPGSSCTSFTFAVAADPAGTRNVTTTLASSPSAGATSFTVSSASGIFIGQYLVIDELAFSGTTVLTEKALVTGVSGTTITVSTGLSHAHSSGANVYHYSDNLGPSTASWSVTIAVTLIAPLGCNGNATETCELVTYNTSLGDPTQVLATTTKSYTYGRFDTRDDLFIADQANYHVYSTTYNSGTQTFGTLSTVGSPPNTGSNFGFDVSIGTATQSGAVGMNNFYYATPGDTPWLSFIPQGGSSVTNWTSSLEASGNWYSPTELQFPSVAVLDNASGTVFGYAFDIANVDDATPDEIVVTTGANGVEQDISSPYITSVSGNDPAIPVLAWDNGRQSLIYVNATTGGSANVIELTRNGTTGASLNAPVSVGSVAGLPEYVAVSRDGTSVAVAWYNGTTDEITWFHNPGTGWTTGATVNPGFQAFTSMHFIPGDNLVATDSGPNQAGTSIFVNLYEFTPSGTQISGSPHSATTDFASSCSGESPNCYVVSDSAVSF